MRVRSVPALTVLALTAALVLSGCGGGDTSIVADGSSTPSASAEESTAGAEPTEQSDSPTPAESSESSEPASTASDFCTVFEQLDDAGRLESGEDVAAVFTQLAADMRATAPAEISDAVNSYADAIELIGRAASGDSVSQAEIAAEQAEALAGKAQEIATIGVWMGRNC